MADCASRAVCLHTPAQQPLQILVQVKIEDFSRRTWPCQHWFHGAPFVEVADLMVSTATTS